jgi:hypothetical protein
MSRRIALSVAVPSGVLLYMLLAPSPVSGQIARLNLTPAGTQSGGTGTDVAAVATSDDGRYVAFVTTAPDLVPGDSNGQADLFVRDRMSNVTHLVTSGHSGGPAAGPGGPPAVQEVRLSGDGSTVVFISTFSNLVPDDTNLAADVFAYDMASGVTTRLSVTVGGQEALNPNVASPAVSTDGSVVAYTTQAGVLTGLPQGTVATVVVDRDAGTRETIAFGPPGPQVPRQWQVEMSGDGRFVAAATDAALLPDDTNGAGDVYVYDRQLQQFERVSVTTTGTQSTAGGPRGSFHPSISADGRFVTFESDSSTLAAQVSQFTPNQVFIRDRTLQTTVRISQLSDGTAGFDSSFNARISSNGDVVTFQSFVGFVPATFSSVNAFAWLRASGTIRLVNIPLDFVRVTGGLGSSDVWPTNAAEVIFRSSEPGLVVDDTNGTADVFVRSLATSEPTVTAVSPATIPRGAPVTLSVTGTGFVPGATAAIVAPALTAPLLPSAVSPTNVTLQLPAITGPLILGLATHHGVASVPVAFCAYTTTPVVAIARTGGQANVQVSTATECPWTASTASPFLSLPGSTAGTGNGMVTVHVAPNDGLTTRSGTVSVGGRTTTILQAGEGGVPVPAGTPQTLQLTVPGGSVSMTFSGVATPGVVTVLPQSTDPTTQGTWPAAFAFLPGSHYDVQSTFSFGSLTVCFPYTEADLGAAALAKSSLRLLHLASSSSAWADVTTTNDTSLNRICGEVTSLSPFAIAGNAGTAFTRYLAEGATSDFFDTRIALLNPGPTAAATTLRFLPGAGAPIEHPVAVPAGTRVTLDVKDIPGLQTAEFSTVVEADQPLVVDRTMTWGPDGYGSHSETAVSAPATTWYLAEGATHSGFNLFYLLQNPATSGTTVRVRYLRTSGAPLEKQYTLAPQSRTNIWVNVEDFPGEGLALASAEMSAVIESLDATPIIVERAMYRSNQGRLFNAGHESAAVTTPATSWFLAEGATGDYFDQFVLIANPTAADAHVTLTYLLVNGQTYSRTLVAPANARSGVWVDVEQFPGVAGFPLADVAVSTTVESTNGVPLVVERAMWWPGSGDTWHEAHNSAGATSTGTRWAVAEGEVGGPSSVETYLLIANTSLTAGSALVTLHFEDGTTSSRTYVLPPQSRTNVAVGPDFGAQVEGKRFGAVVESLGEAPAQIVVERAMYSNAGAVNWAAGSNALATRLQ